MQKTFAPRVSLTLLFSTVAAFGQSAPAFEVASIKKAEPLSANAVMSGQMRLGMTVDAAMVHINAMALTELLRIAYRVKTYQISGPEWLPSERFDITAKMPAGATRDQVPEMLQALLTERFKLTLHRSTTEQSVYALVVAKGGPRLKESPADSDLPAAVPGGPAAPNAPTPTDGSAQVRASATSDTKGVITSSSANGTTKMMTGNSGMRVEMTKMNSTGMVELLGRFVDRPVLDMTDLKGKYDLSLDVGLEDMLTLARGAGVAVPMGPMGDGARASEPGSSSVFAGIQQYGLKLEPRKAPIELLIIDHVERSPTEN